MRRRSRPFRPDRPSVTELAAGALIRPPSRADSVLVLHDRQEDRWCFPKGHVEPGESIRSAAEREVFEETGLRRAVGSVEIGEVHYRFYQPKKRHNVLKTVVYFGGQARSGRVRLEDGFDQYRWLSVATARRVVAYPSDRAILACWNSSKSRVSRSGGASRPKKSRGKG